MAIWRIWIRTILVVILALGSTICLSGQERGHGFRAYYFPIGAETLTPVTSTNIEQRGKRCDIESNKDRRAIKEVLASATKGTSGKFTNLNVRLKLMELSANGEKLAAVVENEGLVKLATGEERQISAKGMERLKRIIETGCKQRL